MCWIQIREVAPSGRTHRREHCSEQREHERLSSLLTWIRHTLEVAQDLGYEEMRAGFAKAFPANTPHLVSIFERFSHYAEEMVLQAANVHDVPWQAALFALLQRIEQQNMNWWLVGSAALAVRGFQVVPHDIDLCTDDASAHTLGVLLGDCLMSQFRMYEGGFVTGSAEPSCILALNG